LYKKDKLNDFKYINRFIAILSIVSIIGFSGVVTDTLFNININHYIEALWMLIIGFGLLIEVKFKSLKSIYNQGLTRNNFNNIITIIIGFFAVFAGLFSFPQLRIESPSFLAIKGILSIIAISIIVIQTWFIKRKFN